MKMITIVTNGHVARWSGGKLIAVWRQERAGQHVPDYMIDKPQSLVASHANADDIERVVSAWLEGQPMKHDENCEQRAGRYIRPECEAYSTDGTTLGAYIAHEMGTMDEQEIVRRTDVALERDHPLTGMEEEQADWEDYK